MNKKQQKILHQIFKRPTSSDIAWSSIESLFKALECEISEGSGSRVRVKINDVRAVFHRPHPSPCTDIGAFDSVGKFLINTGVKL